MKAISDMHFLYAKVMMPLGSLNGFGPSILIIMFFLAFFLYLQCPLIFYIENTCYILPSPSFLYRQNIFNVLILYAPNPSKILSQRN